MHRYLAQHPEIFMSRRKEPRYFARDLDAGNEWEAHYFTRNLDEYLANFADAGDAKVIGESSTWYVYSPTAPELIRDFSPDARVMIMLRNPVHLTHARHQQSVWSGRENIVDFAEALAAESDRREGRRLPHQPVHVRGLQYRAASTMTPLVRRYLDLFGPERVLVVLLEEMARDTIGVYRRVLDFLGVDPNFVPSDMGVANASRSPRNARLRRSLLRFRGLRDRAKKALPRPLQRVIALPLKLRRLNQRRAPRAAMSRELELQLTHEFAPDVAALSNLLGRDLTASWPQFRDVATPPVIPAAGDRSMEPT